MILDKDNEFSDSQAVTASAASTNVIDMGTAGDQGKEMYLLIQVDTAATSDGAATVTFALQTDDNVSFSSAVTLYTTSAIAKATLVAGYQVALLRIPKGVERYLRVYYTVATANLTAGAFSAALVIDPQTNKATSWL